ncbi:YceI family protein [Coraliomargarita sp. W4R72]
MKSKILLLASLLGLTLTAHAQHFTVDKSQSELSATMHASPSHDFTSVAKDYTCDIEIAPETLAVTKAVCRFNFSELDSGKSSRDKKMQNWIDVDTFPEAQFVMTQNLPDNKDDEHVATGTFTMHGVELPITIAYTVRQEGKRILLDGHSTINHEDWGLKQVRLFIFSVNPILKPSFHLEGTLTPDA